MDLTGTQTSSTSTAASAATIKAINSATNNNASASSSLSGDFQSMMQMLLMSSMNGASSGANGLTAMLGNDSSSGTSGVGSSMSMIMLPMMFAMMERLLQKQMELLQAGKLNATSSSDANAQTAAQSSQTAKAQTAQTRSTGSPSESVAVGNQAAPHGQPVQGGWLSQGFSATHNGLDFAVVTGTDVHSSMDGKVVYAGWSPIGYGNLVIVQNGDYQTYYAHLSKIPVSVGQTVEAGGVIGLSGSTGNSTGPHLHYEIRYKGKNIDPTSVTLKVPI